MGKVIYSATPRRYVVEELDIYRTEKANRLVWAPYEAFAWTHEAKGCADSLASQNPSTHYRVVDTWAEEGDEQ